MQSPTTAFRQTSSRGAGASTARRSALLLALLAGLLVAACGQKNSSYEVGSRDDSSAPEAPMPSSAQAPSGSAAGESGGVPSANAQAAAPTVAPSAGASGERKIIKDGTLAIEVEDVEKGVSQVASLATGAGGYVIETKSEQDYGGSRAATVKFAVPAASFEATMDAVKKLATQVLTDASTGQDVSQEFVDVQSDLDNLEATRTRVRGFLDQAETVEEALKVNAELSRLEGEINQKKGRLQFLAQRTAFSTITVTIHRAPGNETPTPIPTTTPMPALDPWNPGDTAVEATRSLQEVMRSLVDGALWFVIVWLPVLAIFAALAWLLSRLGARFLPRGRRNPPPPKA